MRRRSALVPVLALALAAGCGPGDAWRTAELPDRGPVSARAPGLPEDAPRVLLRTSMGDVLVGLYAERAPLSTGNFLAYVEDGFYDGTLFHRVVDRGGMVVVQGGGFDADMNRKQTRRPIANEAANGIPNVRGTVAMARVGGSVGSATSQFYFNVVDNPHLDHRGDDPREFGYAVFGRVLEGMEVVDRISMVPTDGDRPLAAILLEEASRVDGHAAGDAGPDDGR